MLPGPLDHCHEAYRRVQDGLMVGTLVAGPKRASGGRWDLALGNVVSKDAIFVVEDDVGIRSLISSVLSSAGFVVRELPSGEDAIEAARREQPVLVILDVRLPGLSGYEVCGWLRSKFSDGLPIMFISGERTEAFDRAAGLMLGADDYLSKPFSTEELLARVRGLLRRAVPSPRALESKLTVRELEVLRLLAGGLGQKEISGHLVISVKTVGTHIEHILMKLGVQSRTQAVALAYREHLIESRSPEAEQLAPSARPPVGRSDARGALASVSAKTAR